VPELSGNRASSPSFSHERVPAAPATCRPVAALRRRRRIAACPLARPCFDSPRRPGGLSGGGGGDLINVPPLACPCFPLLAAWRGSRREPSPPGLPPTSSICRGGLGARVGDRRTRGSRIVRERKGLGQRLAGCSRCSLASLFFVAPPAYFQPFVATRVQHARFVDPVACCPALRDFVLLKSGQRADGDSAFFRLNTVFNVPLTLQRSSWQTTVLDPQCRLALDSRPFSHVSRCRAPPLGPDSCWLRPPRPPSGTLPRGSAGMASGHGLPSPSRSPASRTCPSGLVPRHGNASGRGLSGLALFPTLGRRRHPIRCRVPRLPSATPFAETRSATQLVAALGVAILIADRGRGDLWRAAARMFVSPAAAWAAARSPPSR